MNISQQLIQIAENQEKVYNAGYEKGKLENSNSALSTLIDRTIVEIEIPEGVTDIGSNAFYGCSKLVVIGIPSTVKTVGTWAFNGCSSLQTVYYTGTEEEWAQLNIGTGNTSLTSANLICRF